VVESGWKTGQKILYIRGGGSPRTQVGIVEGIDGKQEGVVGIYNPLILCPSTDINRGSVTFILSLSDGVVDAAEYFIGGC